MPLYPQNVYGHPHISDNIVSPSDSNISSCPKNCMARYLSLTQNMFEIMVKTNRKLPSKKVNNGNHMAMSDP